MRKRTEVAKYVKVSDEKNCKETSHADHAKLLSLMDTLKTTDTLKEFKTIIEEFVELCNQHLTEEEVYIVPILKKYFTAEEEHVL